MSTRPGTAPRRVSPELPPADPDAQPGGPKAAGQGFEEASYKRTDQNQDSLSGGSTTATHSLNQTETDSFTWNASTLITLALGHSWNRLDQDSPGAGDLENPLLPYGSDSFNTSYSTNSLNAHYYSHTFTGRVTEQVDKALSLWQEGGYTRTVDTLRGGTVDTYSPAAGFAWRPGTFLNWTGSYQYNGSMGQVSTVIQKAQSTLSASLNPGTTLSANWTWSRADNPFVLSQQATTSFTMNF